jgi:predicted metal-dependent TIM-barrel fold hydrolase
VKNLWFTEDFVAAIFWPGMTLQPYTKLPPQRAADVINMYHSELVSMNSAGDCAGRDRLAFPKDRMDLHGHFTQPVDRVIFDNPRDFLSQSFNFKLNLQ